MNVKVRFKLSLAGVLAVILLLSGLPVKAAENSIAMKVMQTSEKVTLYENADETSAVVDTFDKGTPVIIQEEEQDGWCRVSYKEIEGYLKASQLEMIGDIEALAEEFEDMDQSVQLIFESIVLREQETRQKRIWGTVIVVLVVAIFGVGIVSSIKNGKNNNEK